MPKLKVKIASLELKNPVLTASGTYGYGREFAEIYDLSLLGGVVVKGTTYNPWPGNPPPRIAETPSGILNSVGLQNPGVDEVIAREIPFLQQFNTLKIINIAGRNIEEYRLVAEKLAFTPGVDALEVNISCPNVACGGMAFGTDAKIAGDVTDAVRKSCKLPIIVKLSPNVTDIGEIAKAVEDKGADAVSLINTIMGMAIDPYSRKPIMANIIGGLSGPAIKPIALRMVWQAAKAVNIPVIGMGGIESHLDAVEFLLAGASAVQIGAANFYNPLVCPEVIAGLEDYLNQEKIEDINELMGALKI